MIVKYFTFSRNREKFFMFNCSLALDLKPMLRAGKVAEKEGESSPKRLELE